MGKHYVITQLPFCLRVAFQIPTKLSIFIQKYFIPPLWPTVLFVHGKTQDGPLGPVEGVKVWDWGPKGRKHIFIFFCRTSLQISTQA